MFLLGFEKDDSLAYLSKGGISLPTDDKAEQTDSVACDEKRLSLVRQTAARRQPPEE